MKLREILLEYALIAVWTYIAITAGMIIGFIIGLILGCETCYFPPDGGCHIN